MKFTKKAISLLLAALMLLSLANFPAYAKDLAPTSAPKELSVPSDMKTILNDSFETYKINAFADRQFTSIVGNKTYITVEEIAGNKVLKFFNTDTKDHGPRIEKKLVSGLTKVYLEFASMNNAEGPLLVSINDGKKSQVVYQKRAENNSKNWNYHKYEFDLAAMKATAEVDGVVVAKDVDFSTLDLSDTSKVALNLGSGLAAGGEILFDNVIIYTPDDVNTFYVEDTGPVSFAPTSAPKVLSVPSEMYTILNDGFENYKSDAFAEQQFTSIVGNKTYIKIEEFSGNKVLKFFNTDTKDHGPRIEKKLESGIQKVYLEFASMNNSAGPLLVSINDGKKSQVVYQKRTPSDGKTWNYHKYEFDLAAMKATAEVDGVVVAKDVDFSTLDLSDTSKVALNLNAGLAADGEVLLDNMIIYTPDKFDTLFYYDGTFNYESLTVENPTGLSEVMLKSHPRVLVTDWNEIREKINTDPYCAKWYANLVKAADEYISKNEYVEYSINARGNLNDIASSFRDKVVILGFVAGVSGDRKYADLLFREIRNAEETWQDWGEDVCMVGSKVIRGIATAYDWAYDVFTAEERARIEDILINHAGSIIIKQYTGILLNGYEVLRAIHNQAMGVHYDYITYAIAINDIAPNIAEYIFRGTATNLPNTLVEMSDDGGFAEPMEYWTHGVGSLVNGIAALENCVAPGQTLPDCLNFALSANFAETPDHMIYYDGATKCFNFNASTADQVSSPLLLRIADRYNKPQYAWYELTKNQSQASKLYTGRTACEAIIYYNPEKVSSADFALDKFFKNNRLYGPNGMSMRSSWDRDTMLFAAMQGGDNQSFHSYFSLGTFVLDWEGERFALLTGKDSRSNTYTVDSLYQGASTDLYFTRTEGSNTLTINPDAGPGQKADGFGLLIASDSAENGAYGVLNLTRTRDDLNKHHRGMMMTHNRTRIVIQDEVSAKKPSEIYWFMHTTADITISEDGKGALLELNGKRIYARINAGPNDAAFSVMTIDPLPTSPNPPIQKGEYLARYTGDKKLAIHVNNVTEMTLSVEFIPLRAGEGIPNDTTAVTPMASWSVNKGETKRIEERLGDVVALKLGTPAAYAKGVRTYVDTDNKDVFPFTENGRTLVPVRFIAENFGAKVSWTEATQTVDIACGDDTIRMVLGSNEMTVNGQTVTLDVPAQTYNARTLIPLRALAEALGKKVFWDDRGLIIISSEDKAYDEATIADACKMLDVRVLAGAQEISFRPEMKDYYITAPVSEVSVLVNENTHTATVAQGNPAVVTIDGANYNIHFTEDPFKGIAGTGGEGAVAKLNLRIAGAAGIPDHQTYITVVDVASSTGWAKYPKFGSVDGIISAAMEDRWTGEGKQWISYDFGEVKKLHSFALATTDSFRRTFTLGVDISDDGTNWTTLLPSITTKLGDGPTVFALGDVSARYVRLNTHYNSEGTIYHSYAEVRFYADAVMEAEDQAAWNAIFKISDAEGKVGDKLKVEVTAKDSTGAAVDLSSHTLTFESSDDSIISVDANGNCTLKKAGTATIKLTTTRPGALPKTAELVVLVK